LVSDNLFQAVATRNFPKGGVACPIKATVMAALPEADSKLADDKINVFL
jgi:hypothetical protein